MELEGQVAIITGAGRGIGRATALELGRMGAHIVVAELDPANAERTASEVSALGRRAPVVPTDVTSRKDLEGMVKRTHAEFGRIDVLVNNAGIYRAAKTLDVTEEHWDAVMNINAKAVFFASQAALPTMIGQKRGVIVNLASMAGKVGSRANLPYNASKAAVISMTKSLALAHAADGIRVNCVCPGFVETDMWTSLAQQLGPLFKQSPEEFASRSLRQIPLGRMERPDDVANVIGFLVSPRSEYMTGQALSVDGGLVMHG
jgi:NAD(P)-dependent dehydrogenase (short-subunit alcohol dehydrogenase family)